MRRKTAIKLEIVFMVVLGSLMCMHFIKIVDVYKSKLHLSCNGLCISNFYFKKKVLPLGFELGSLDQRSLA